MAPSDKTLLVVFYAFSLSCQLLLTASLLTAAAARLRRELTLINPAIGGLVFSTACLMLLFANEFRNPVPRFSLCLAQSCFIYGGLTMISSSVCCLFFQLWYGLRGIVRKSEGHSNAIGVVLKALPWISFSGMLFAALIDGLQRRTDVSRSRDYFYCAGSHRLGYTSEMLSGVFLLASLLLELHIVFMLFCGWRAGTLRKSILPMDSIIRLGFFSIYALFSLVAIVILVHYQTANSPRSLDMFLSTVPLAIWVIFWTQKDMLEIWTCRKIRVLRGPLYNMKARKIRSTREDLTLREMNV